MPVPQGTEYVTIVIEGERHCGLLEGNDPFVVAFPDGTYWDERYQEDIPPSPQVPTDEEIRVTRTCFEMREARIRQIQEREEEAYSSWRDAYDHMLGITNEENVPEAREAVAAVAAAHQRICGSCQYEIAMLYSDGVFNDED